MFTCCNLIQKQTTVYLQLLITDTLSQPNEEEILENEIVKERL